MNESSSIKLDYELKHSLRQRASSWAQSKIAALTFVLFVLATLTVLPPDLHNDMDERLAVVWASLAVLSLFFVMRTPHRRSRWKIALVGLGLFVGGTRILHSTLFFGEDPHGVAYLYNARYSRIERLGYRIDEYRETHSGEFPVSIDAFDVREYARTYLQPTLDTAVIVYLRPPDNKPEASFIVAYEKKPAITPSRGWRDVSVLFGDGNAKMVDDAALAKLLDKQPSTQP